MEVRILSPFKGDLILNPLAVPHERLKSLDFADHLLLEPTDRPVNVFVVWFSLAQQTQSTKEDGHMGKFKSKKCGHGGNPQIVSVQAKTKWAGDRSFLPLTITLAPPSRGFLALA